MAIFVTMTGLVIMANMMKMAIIATIGYYELASNMTIRDILKKNKNAVQTRKQFVN